AVACPVDWVNVHRRSYDRDLGAEFEVGLDRAVGEFSGKVRLPIVLQPSGKQGIEQAIEHGIWHRRNHLSNDGRNLADRREYLISVVGGASPAADENAKRLAMICLRNERQRRRNLKRGEHAQFFWRRFDEVAKELQDIASVGHWKEEKARDDILNRMELILERRDYAKVAAAPAQRPEQILIFIPARDEQPAVCCYHISR